MAVHQSAVSSYLVRPNVNPRRYGRWNGFKGHLVSVSRSNPHALPRLFTAILMWSSAIALWQYITFKPATPTITQTVANSSYTAAALKNPESSPPVLSLTKPTVATTAETASTQTATTQPPNSIYVAPYLTYANTYTAGQCTWYVASRRQVPPYWGNADNWYYRAEIADWAVGSYPKTGAIAWTDAGYYGHVAIVEAVSASGTQVEVSEMNYYGPYIIDSRWTATSAFKYIY